MLKQRILTALVLIPLAVALVCLPSLETFSAILIGVFGVMAWEWSRLLQTNAIISTVVILIAVAIAGYGHYYLAEDNYFEVPRVSELWYETYPFKALMVAVMLWIIAAVWVMLYPKATNTWSKGPWVRALCGLVILPSAWLAVVMIRSGAVFQGDLPLTAEQASTHGAQLLLLMFLVIWAADVGAYFSGKAWGKTKLAKVVSPNKTWEGAMGGMVFAMILGVTSAYFMGLLVSIMYLVPFIALWVFVSILGDLFESMMKRQAGIKDSSNILPGHGGLLDRLDSTLSVAPFFVVTLLIFA